MTEINKQSGIPRVVVKEIPVVKPIIVLPGEAQLQEHMEEAVSLLNMDAEAFSNVEDALSEDETVAIRVAMERRKQMVGASTPNNAIGATPTPTIRHCLSCGKELPAKAKFCNKCGKPA